MSNHEEDLLKEDPELGDMFTDDEIDSNEDDDDDQDFIDEFRGYNFSRSGSMRQKKMG